MASEKDRVRPAKARTATEALVTGVAAIAVLILLNVLAAFAPHAKLDLTDNGIYSLSGASKDMVRALDEKVNVKAYFGNIPIAAEANQKYVEALLEEYRDASGGKITFEKIDPTSDTKLQEELKKIGVDKIKLFSQQGDKKEEVKMYFHVVFSYLDRREVWLPQGGFSLEGLEYEFSFRIKRLARGRKTRVGITTGFGETQHTQLLAMEGKELRFLPGMKFGLADLYDVAPVDWSKDPRTILPQHHLVAEGETLDAIAGQYGVSAQALRDLNGISASGVVSPGDTLLVKDGIDILIVNGPTKPISDVAKYYLDQHVMQGKPVLFLVRGIKWESAGNPQLPPEMQEDQPYTGMPNDHGLGDLLAQYGIEVQANTIIDPKASAVTAVPPGTRVSLRRGFAPVATVLPRGPRQMLQGMERMVVPWTSSIKLVGPLEKGEGYEIIPVLRSQPTAIAREGVLPLVKDGRLSVSDKDVPGPHLLAVAVSGKWTSLYAGKPVPEGAAPPLGETLQDSPQNTRLLVIGSAAIADDMSLADALNIHLDFSYANGFLAIHNLVDWLAQDTTLIATRSKVVERRIEDTSDATRTLIKIGNIAGPPLALSLFGLFFWIVRERRRKSISL